MLSNCVEVRRLRSTLRFIRQRRANGALRPTGQEYALVKANQPCCGACQDGAGLTSNSLSLPSYHSTCWQQFPSLLFSAHVYVGVDFVFSSPLRWFLSHQCAVRNSEFLFGSAKLTRNKSRLFSFKASTLFVDFYTPLPLYSTRSVIIQNVVPKKWSKPREVEPNSRIHAVCCSPEGLGIAVRKRSPACAIDATLRKKETQLSSSSTWCTAANCVQTIRH